jgi:excisionase family DNA binding protein
MEKEFLTAADLAPLLGVTRGRVYQLIAAGIIPAARFGQSVRIPRAAWERWLADQAHRAMEAVHHGVDRPEPEGGPVRASEPRPPGEDLSWKQGSAT